MSALATLNRFGLGARPFEATRIRDPKAWLLAQLEGEAPPRALPTGASPSEVQIAIAEVRAAAASGDRDRLLRARQATARIGALEAASCLAARVVTGRPFVERWIAFWQNHLCISIRANVSIPPLAGGYERDAIRANAFGRFEELLLASARHPAMLTYLNNSSSVGPRSRVGTRASLGLNENYARELLELHTLGVDGGYNQSDVTELARLLTGWSVSQRETGRSPTFRFVANRHDPGVKVVMGESFGEGEAEGERAIRRLARHPSTARHVSVKLARHFVSDDPPAALIASLQASFARSEGDLRVVASTLVRHPDSWKADARKFRSPQDWLVAALRAMGHRGNASGLTVSLQRLRQPMWAPPAPSGYGDLVRDWADPGGLLNRAEYARTLGRRWRPSAAAVRAARETFGADGALDTLLNDGDIAIGERAALLFASPSFQWR